MDEKETRMGKCKVFQCETPLEAPGDEYCPVHRREPSVRTKPKARRYQGRGGRRRRH